MAVAALVLGIIGFVLAIIPFANYVAYPLVVLAIIFGLLAIGWGKAKAGLILGVLGLAATIAWTAAIASVFHNGTSKAHTVVYTITGTGKADIQYFQIDGSGNDQTLHANAQTLPWTKTVTIKGDFSSFDVTASPTDFTSNSKLSCTLTVDGKQVSSDTAGSIVTCDGNGTDG
jgi:hypothetical protein